MSEPSDTPTPTPEPAAEPTPAPTPQYATVADMQRIEATIAGQFEAFQQSLRTLTDRATAPPPKADAEWTDEQLDTAVDEGRLTRSQAARYIAEKAVAKLQREVVDPLRETGLNSIAGLTKTAALPLMPRYKTYQKEIDAMVERLPASTRITPEVYVWAHNAIVGAHASEIEDAAREAAIRSAGAPRPESSSSGASGRGGGRAAASGQVPSPAELLGEEAAAAIDLKCRERGWTLDHWAQKLSPRYKGGWKAYAEEYAKQNAEVA